MFPTDYIYETIFGLSEEDYLEMRELVREDAKRAFRQSQIENEGNDPAKSGKSYGTPHDLASMYGRRSTPAPKGAEQGKVPAGYEEDPRPHADLNRPGDNPEGGRPRIRASFYGTQDNPAGGADPTGRMNMHQPYKSDYEYVMENYEHPTNLDFREKKTVLEEQRDIEDSIGMLDESNVTRVESFLDSIPAELIRKSGKDKEV